MFQLSTASLGEKSPNKSLHRTFDPLPIFTSAQIGSGSNAGELRGYARKKFVMLKILLISVVSIFPMLSLASNSDECEDKCQKMKVNEYFSLLSDVYNKDSTIEDVDALFKVLSQTISYEHLTYGASFNRKEWREAFYRNLERGAYNHESNQFIRVDNIIHGNGYVAVAYSYVFKSKSGAIQPKGDQNLMAVFGLTNGKISSVKEYW